MLILATIEGLRDEKEVSGDGSPQLDITWRNGLRLLRMVDDLLELTKLESAMVKLTVQTTDVARLAADLVEQMQPMAVRKSVAVVYEGMAFAEARVDAGGIERVVSNLVSNALKFTHEGGTITVRVTGEDPVSISVQDTGIGIPAEDLQHIFERFYQGRAGKEIKRGGVGIGLSMCKRIIELHGGSVKVASIVGKGTTITFCIARNPAFEAGVLAEETSGQAAPRSGGLLEWDQRIRNDRDYRFVAVRDAGERRVVPRSSNESAKHSSVLVIDDNPDIVNLLASALADEHNIYAAGDGKEGLALARRFRPDIIVSDVTMPGMDGFDMLAKIRADPQLHDTPVIMMTSRGEQADALTSDTLEADVFLPKPFSNKQIRAIVRRLLHRQQALATQATHASSLSNQIAAAGMAHDILNPLGFIRSAAYLIELNQETLQQPELIENHAAARASNTRALSSINAGVERIVDCVEALRMSASGKVRDPEPLDINYIVQRTLAVTASTVGLHPSLGATRQVMARRGQLDRVLLNLILNALEAGGEGCAISVSTADSGGDMVRVAVADNGPGMDAETLNKATDPYYSTKARGSGLGLAMCKLLVQESHGTFTIASELGKGSVFTIELPAKPVTAVLDESQPDV